MPLKNVLDSLSGFLFLYLSSVGLVHNYSSIKYFFEVFCLALLFLEIVKTVSILNASHMLKLPFEVQYAIKNTESLLENFSFHIAHQSSLCHTLVENLLNLGHHQNLCITYSVFVCTLSN